MADNAVEDEPGGQHGYRIAALARGLAVLDAFSTQRRELSLKDIAEAAHVTQPSALRIGYTLVEAGYLVRNPATKGYRPGPRVVAVGLGALSAMPLPEIAEPYLAGLRDRTHETVKLAVPAGSEAVVVAYLPSRRYPPGDQYVGSRIPIHAGSIGQAILAWLPEPAAKAALGGAATAKLTPKTPTPAQVARRLPAIRQRGFAINDQGTTAEHRSAAAPVFSPSGTPVGAVNISVSVARVTLDDLVQRLAPMVVDTAAQISAVLPPRVLGAGSTA